MSQSKVACFPSTSLHKYLNETLKNMTIDDILELVRSFDGAPDGKIPATTQPFATVVTKNYPDDERSRLERPGTYRINIEAGKAEFVERPVTNRTTCRKIPTPAVPTPGSPILSTVPSAGSPSLTRERQLKRQSASCYIKHPTSPGPATSVEQLIRSFSRTSPG